MKKVYIVPDTQILTYRTESLLYQASVSYGGENNDQSDEAKPGEFEEESSYSLPSINYDVWAEEEESDSYFKTK